MTGPGAQRRPRGAPLADRARRRRSCSPSWPSAAAAGRAGDPRAGISAPSARSLARFVRVLVALQGPDGAFDPYAGRARPAGGAADLSPTRSPPRPWPARTRWTWPPRCPGWTPARDRALDVLSARQQPRRRLRRAPAPARQTRGRAWRRRRRGARLRRWPARPEDRPSCGRAGLPRADDGLRAAATAGPAALVAAGPRTPPRARGATALSGRTRRAPRGRGPRRGAGTVATSGRPRPCVRRVGGACPADADAVARRLRGREPVWRGERTDLPAWWMQAWPRVARRRTRWLRPLPGGARRGARGRARRPDRRGAGTPTRSPRRPAPCWACRGARAPGSGPGSGPRRSRIPSEPRGEYPVGVGRGRCYNRPRPLGVSGRKACAPRIRGRRPGRASNGHGRRGHRLPAPRAGRAAGLESPTCRLANSAPPRGCLGPPGGLQRAALHGAQAESLVDDLHRHPRHPLRHRRPALRRSEAEEPPASRCTIIAPSDSSRKRTSTRSTRRPKRSTRRRSSSPEPVIKDEEISDHVETDNDLPFEESLGEDGISDAPFTGPANNGLIGLGGGAGGAFGGRGGSRDLGGAAAASATRAPSRTRCKWLAAHQSPNGGWEAAGFGKWCDGKPARAGPGRRGQGRSTTPGVTGLALCAFLGAGYTNRGRAPLREDRRRRASAT